ncbi:MAG TPA: pyridoxamine 5'-phosphate oxidase family protein [Candidatus Blautia intestinipullorum]|nr:pyridoxamine 5'-phosphate oxidase family protein [Candidatus Blautia intestinipullorum]
MFREMRRKKQLLSQKECETILTEETSGVLALAGDDDYPYAVPISYVYDGGKIFFHSAKSGHKLDAIRRNPKASFCVISQDLIVPEEYTTYFRSVIAFGRIRVLEEDSEKRDAIEKLAAKYSPGETAEDRTQAIEREWKPLCMLEMTIDHLTGKEAIELVRKKKQDSL